MGYTIDRGRARDEEILIKDSLKDSTETLMWRHKIRPEAADPKRQNSIKTNGDPSYRLCNGAPETIHNIAAQCKMQGETHTLRSITKWLGNQTGTYVVHMD